MRLLAPPTIASAPQRRNSGTQHSDDPPIFGSNLLEEYILVQQLCEFSLDQMRELAANAVEASFLPPPKNSTSSQESNSTAKEEGSST